MPEEPDAITGFCPHCDEETLHVHLVEWRTARIECYLDGDPDLGEYDDDAAEDRIATGIYCDHCDTTLTPAQTIPILAEMGIDFYWPCHPAHNHIVFLPVTDGVMPTCPPSLDPNTPLATGITPPQPGTSSSSTSS